MNVKDKLGAVTQSIFEIQSCLCCPNLYDFSERSYGSEVEHSLGKGEVAGSSPAMSSI